MMALESRETNEEEGQDNPHSRWLGMWEGQRWRTWFETLKAQNPFHGSLHLALGGHQGWQLRALGTDKRMSHEHPKPRPRQISIQLVGGLDSRTGVAGLNGGEYLCYLDVCHRCFPPFPCIFFFLSHHNTLRGASLYMGILDHTQPANREEEGWLDHGLVFFFGCFCFVSSCYFRLAERRCIFFSSLGQFFFSLFSVGKLRIGEEIERGLGTYQPQPVAAGYI